MTSEKKLMPIPLYTIVAVDVHGNMASTEAPYGIPWKGTEAGSEDMKFFREMTAGSTLIVGRVTYENMGPLAGRNVVVVTSSDNIAPHPKVAVVRTFDEAYLKAVELEREKTTNPHIFAAGGVGIYEAAFKHYAYHTSLITVINGNAVSGNAVTSSEYLYLKKDSSEPKFTAGSFIKYPMASMMEAADSEYVKLERTVGSSKNIYGKHRTKARNINCQYAAFLDNIMACGDKKICRQGLETYYYSGASMTIPVHDNRGLIWPLLTTKKMAWKTVVWELVWFMRGETDTKFLTDRGVKIWNLNTSAQELAKSGANVEPGHIGKGYGYQWRHWNGGVDQLARVIESLRTNPCSRRHVVTAWNPSDMGEAALPPCHMMFQFVSDGKYTDIIITMRSADLFLGLPFNIASYTMLLHLIARATGLKPRRAHISMGDAHIYLPHVDAIKKQAANTQYSHPRAPVVNIDFNSPVDGRAVGPETPIEEVLAALESFTPDCVHIDYVEGIHCHARIEAKLF